MEKKLVNRNRPRSDIDNTVISKFKISDYKYIEAFKEKYNIMKLQVKNIKKILNGNFRVENTIYEMKILMDDINYRLKTTEEKFSDLQDRVIEAIQTEIYREKAEKEMKDLHDV